MPLGNGETARIIRRRRVSYERRKALSAAGDPLNGWRKSSISTCFARIWKGRCRAPIELGAGGRPMTRYCPGRLRSNPPHPQLQVRTMRLQKQAVFYMSDLYARHGRRLVQTDCAARVPNTGMTSAHPRVPRGVPILGSTDCHLAAVFCSAMGVMVRLWHRRRLMPRAGGGRVRR
jgi:hypothetical protein